MVHQKSTDEIAIVAEPVRRDPVGGQQDPGIFDAAGAQDHRARLQAS
jgi:hypothetical protein